MNIEFFNCDNSKFNIAMSIRNLVFEDEQGAIADEEIDTYDSDKNTVFALVYDNDNAVATGRIARLQNGFKIGRIAVLKSQRGKGTGAFLVDSLCQKCVDLGAKKIYVDSQLHAVEFYEKLGFYPTGESEIIDRGIRHLPMVKL